MDEDVHPCLTVNLVKLKLNNRLRLQKKFCRLSLNVTPPIRGEKYRGPKLSTVDMEISLDDFHEFTLDTTFEYKYWQLVAKLEEEGGVFESFTYTGRLDLLDYFIDQLRTEEVVIPLLNNRGEDTGISLSLVLNITKYLKWEIKFQYHLKDTFDFDLSFNDLRRIANLCPAFENRNFLFSRQLYKPILDTTFPIRYTLKSIGLTSSKSNLPLKIIKQIFSKKRQVKQDIALDWELMDSDQDEMEIYLDGDELIDSDDSSAIHKDPRLVRDQEYSNDGNHDKPLSVHIDTGDNEVSFEMKIADLPDDCLIAIFKHLDAFSRGSCYFVCHRWNEIIQNMHSMSPYFRSVNSDSKFLPHVNRLKDLNSFICNVRYCFNGLPDSEFRLYRYALVENLVDQIEILLAMNDLWPLCVKKTAAMYNIYTRRNRDILDTWNFIVAHPFAIFTSTDFHVDFEVKWPNQFLGDCMQVLSNPSLSEDQIKKVVRLAVHIVIIMRLHPLKYENHYKPMIALLKKEYHRYITKDQWRYVKVVYMNPVLNNR